MAVEFRFGQKTLYRTGTISRAVKKLLKKSTAAVPPSRGVLPKGGRSSVEDPTLSGLMGGLQSFYDVVTPRFPIEVLDYISRLCAADPDLSRGIQNLQGMANNGHKLVVLTDNKALKEKAIRRLHEKSRLWYDDCAGVDGLFNMYIRQGFITSAFSRENILQEDFRGVERVAIVPASTIRFKYENGEWKKYQQTNGFVSGGAGMGNLVELNPYTYNYYALQKEENSPYALPVLLAVLKSTGMLDKVYESVDRFVNKVSLLGLIDIKCSRPQPRPGESFKDADRRYQEIVDETAKEFAEVLKTGVFVRPEDKELNHHKVTNDAKGLSDIIAKIDQRKLNAIGQDPSLHGREYRVPETFARVLYNTFLNNCKNFRRIIKRLHEGTCNLDLSLADLPIDKVSVVFNKDNRFDPNTEALADRYVLSSTIDKVRYGLIDPDEAAQELGYDNWFDVKVLRDAMTTNKETTELSWNKDLNEYELIRHSIDLDRVKKVSLEEQDKEDQKQAKRIDRKLQEMVQKYFSLVMPYYENLPDDVTEFAVEYVQAHLEEVSQDTEPFMDALRNFVKQNDIYKNVPKKRKFRVTVEKFVLDTGKYWKEADTSAFVGKPPEMTFTFNDGDVAAMKVYSNIDNFCFSSFINNKDFGSEIKGFMNNFFERGEGLFENWTAEIEKEFRFKFGAAFQGDSWYQMRRILNTSMGRVQLYGHLGQLNEAGFKTAIVNEILDERTCSVCRKMHGKIFVVAVQWKKVKKVIDAGSVEESLELIKEYSVTSDEQADELIDGETTTEIPPYHVECRGSLKGKFE